MVATPALGAGAVRRVGSSPTKVTNGPVAQLGEAMVLEAIQCGFESH